MDILDQLVADLSDGEFSAIGEETPFAECEGWNSLKHVELVVGIQARYEVDLSPDEIAQLTCKHAVRAVLAARGFSA